MPITVEVDDRNVTLRLGSMNDRVKASLRAAINADRLKLEEYIKAEKLSGQVLHVQTGNLRASIFSALEDEGNRIGGRVYSSGVPYAAIHEFGGDIYPKTARALVFEIDGRKIFAQHVRMPERSYMRSSLADMKAQLEADMIKAVTTAVQEK